MDQNEAENPTGPAAWHVRTLDGVLEVLHKMTDSLNAESDFAKMDGHGDELRKLNELKIGVIRWLMELTKQKFDLKFGFDTKNAELDEKLEETVSEMFLNRNMNISFDNLLSEVGADAYFMIQENRIKLETTIMDKISQKLLSIFTKTHTEKIASDSDSESTSESNSDDGSEESPPEKKLKENEVSVTKSPEKSPQTSVKKTVPPKKVYIPTEKEMKKNPFLRPDSYGNFDVPLAKKKLQNALALKRAGFSIKNFDISKLPKRPDDKSKWTREDHLVDAFGLPYQILQAWKPKWKNDWSSDDDEQNEQNDESVEILDVPKVEPEVIVISDNEEEEEEKIPNSIKQSPNTTNSFTYVPIEEDDGPSTSTRNDENRDEIEFVGERISGSAKRRLSGGERREPESEKRNKNEARKNGSNSCTQQ